MDHNWTIQFWRTFFCWDTMDNTLVRDTDLFFFFVDLKNSTYLFQAQHIKYRKDTLPRTKVLSWWIRCYSTSMVIAALTQFSIFTGLKCFSKPVTDKLVFPTEEVSPFPHPLSKRPNKWMIPFFRLLHLWSTWTMDQQSTAPF